MLLIIICTFATMSHKTKHCESMRFFFLLLWLFFALQTSEAKGWFFHTIDVKNGLADNYVRDISTDSEGYTWFSTINGLSRYDGYRFVNFQPQKSGAHSADVLMVRETSDGTLWMVCPNDFFTFDRSEHKWKLDGKEKLKQSGIEGETISSFYVDEDGDLWVATGIDIKPSEITVSSLDEELVTHLISEVEANISDPNYSVVQLSSAIGMTRGTLYKKLMAIVGKSPVEFIRIIRLKRAKSFLDQGRTNISEVADKVGFSPKMFAQYFRETYGETPSEYLKNKKSKNK